MRHPRKFIVTMRWSRRRDVFAVSARWMGVQWPSSLEVCAAKVETHRLTYIIYLLKHQHAEEG
jgi:hypothetical protein